MTVSAATVASPAPPALAPARWIVSRNYDLAWFFGGAVASLAALGLYFGLGVSILVLWWVWLLAFDGPHIAAAFTRTYVDREEWRARRGLLAGSLAASFLLGPLCLVAGAATGSQAPFLAFLGFAAFYGYYHIVRQHYGFLALYKTANRDFSKADFVFDKWALYVGCFAPYLYFLATHPKARAMVSLPPEGGAVAGWALLAAWVGMLLAFAVRAAHRFGRDVVRRPQVAYLLVTVVLSGAIYFLVARFEPVYARSNGPDQDFLLLSVLTTIFHNVQYLGLVWFHNRNRYANGDAAFGPAVALNRTYARFLIACGAFSLIYLLFACWTGVFPGCALFLEARVGPFSANQIGLCLWWGLGIHHYVLDQRIWRVRGDPVLRRNLGLA